MNIHPLCLLFPSADAETYERIKDRIKRNGQPVPIETYEGQILIGKEQHRACLELGDDPTIVPSKATNLQEAWQLAMESNGGRKHYKAEQWAMIFLDAVEAFPELSRLMQEITDDRKLRSQLGRKPTISGTLAYEGRKYQGVSLRIMYSAMKVRKVYGKEAADRVKRGEISINKLIEEETKKNKADLSTVQGKYSVLYADPCWANNNVPVHSMRRGTARGCLGCRVLEGSAGSLAGPRC